jgi:F-type H+/Na+-transporting ATPase subunit alpha
VENEVVSIWAGTNGHLDDVPIDDVSRFESEFLDSLKRNNAGILDSIRETNDLSDDTASALKDAIDQFRATFEKSDGELLVTEEQAEALSAEETGQETVHKYTNQQPEEGPVDANSPTGGDRGPDSASSSGDSGSSGDSSSSGSSGENS